MIDNDIGAHDAQCLFEAALEKLRIEFRITSQKRQIAAQARALINSYYSDKKTRESVLARWYRD